MSIENIQRPRASRGQTEKCKPQRLEATGKMNLGARAKNLMKINSPVRWWRT